MPEVIAETLVAIRPKAEPREFEREIRDAVNDAERRAPAVEIPVQAGAGQIANLARAAQGLVAAVGIQQVAQFVGQVADASGDLAEAQNAANVQFDDGIDIVAEFAANTATGLGISERAALEAASAFGGMFGNIGIATDQSALLSRGAVQLAGDLASLRNLGVDDALVKIQAGLAGESEPLRRFGVDISDAAVQAKALELGIGGASAELTQGQKVLARYALIVEQLDEAQGDYARTSDGYANSTKTLSAAVEDLSAAAGDLLTPTIAETTTNIAFLARAADDLIGKFSGNTGLASAIAHVVNPYLTGFNDVVTKIRQATGDAGDETDIYAETQQALEDAIGSATDSMVDQAKVLDRQVSAILDGVEAGLNQRDAAVDVADAQRNVTEAERDYADALAGTGPYAQKAAAAADKVAEANRRLYKDQERLHELTLDMGEAQENLAAAQIRYGVGSKEARDAARNLERTQFDLGETNKDVADSAGELADAQKEAAAAADRTKAIEDASRKLEDARSKLERATLKAASADVELAKQQAEARGETWDTRDAIDAAVTALDKWAGALGPDAPFGKELRARTLELAALNDEAERALGLFPAEPPQVGAGGLAPGAVGAGGLAAGAAGAGSLSSGAVGVGGLQAKTNIERIEINLASPLAFDQVIEQAEYASGVR